LARKQHTVNAQIVSSLVWLVNVFKIGDNPNNVMKKKNALLATR
jgi:hypothetical protein